jgi:hypothetical protein
VPEAPGDGAEVGAGGQEPGGGVVPELLQRAGDADPATPSDAPVEGFRVPGHIGLVTPPPPYVSDAGSARARIGRGICQKMASANACGLYLPSGFFG